MKLVEGKFYVGSTPLWRKETRLAEHRRGCGAKWTTRYPPVLDDPIIETWVFSDRKAAEAFENEKCEEMLELYGIDSTRGGLQNYGQEGGYRWWVRLHLRHLVPSDYDYES